MRSPRTERARVPTSSFELQTKKSLGQHFLTDRNVISKIAKAIEGGCADANTNLVIEIGPGAGALTKPLLQKNLDVFAIEKDDRAIAGLTETLAMEFPRQFQIIQGDILKWEPDAAQRGKVCVGNLPYYITSDIFLWCCHHADMFPRAYFMVQDEVADRINAKPGTKDYGRLTARMQLFFKIKKLFVVSPNAFRPPPKVYSAIVALEPTSFRFESMDEDDFFGRFTGVLFSARRKMLRRALAEVLALAPDENAVADFWHVAAEHKLGPEVRPDVCAPEALLAMHRVLWRWHQHRKIL